MVWVNPKIAEIVAKDAGVIAAVIETRDKLAAKAEAQFATHDHPGGHSITKQERKPDALVSLEGPAPLSVEYGHWTKDHKKHVEGLHVLGRAVAEMEAEGRA